MLPTPRELLLEIRHEHPTASVPLILRTLVADGRLAAGVVSDTTVARLYRDAGLERGVVVDGHTRLRWQTAAACAMSPSPASTLVGVDVARRWLPGLRPSPRPTQSPQVRHLARERLGDIARQRRLR